MRDHGAGLIVYLLLAAAIIAVVAAHRSWSARDKALPFGDENRYLAAMDKAREAWRAPSIGAKLHGLSEVHPTHPPLFPSIAGWWAENVGEDRQSLLLLPLFFFGVMGIATFLAGTVLGAPTRGAAAVLLLAASPLVFRYTHRFFLEMAATAWTALALWLLFSWREHGGWKRAILLGVFLYAGLLTKWTVSVFVFAPALVVGLEALKRDDKSVLQLVIGLGLGVVAAAPWYILHFDRLRAFVAWNQENAYWELASLKTLAGWLFYVKRLPLMMSAIPFALFAAGIVAALFRWRREGALVVGVIVPLVVFTLFRTKAFDGRHLLPLFPAAALLASSVVRAKSDYLRWSAWTLVLIAVPLGLLPASGLALEQGLLRRPIPGTSVPIAGHFEAPAPHDDGASRVASRISSDMTAVGRSSARVFCVVAYGSLNADGLNALARDGGEDIVAFNPEPRAAGERANDAARWGEIVDADYVVVKEGLVYDSNVNGYRDAYPFWADYFCVTTDGYPSPRPRRIGAAFVTLDAVSTPDGDRVWIGRRARPLSDTERAEIVTVAARIDWLIRARRGEGTAADASLATETGARWLNAAVPNVAVRDAAIQALDINTARARATWGRLAAAVRTDFWSAPLGRWRAFARALLDAPGPHDDAWTDDAYAVVIVAPDDDPLALELFQRWLGAMRARGRLDRVIGFLKRREDAATTAVRKAMRSLRTSLETERHGAMDR